MEEVLVMVHKIVGMKIGAFWKEIPRGSLIFVSKDTSVATLSGRRILPKGYYWINGFWADVVGLAKSHENYKKEINDFVIPSKNLQDFRAIKVR